MLHSTRRHGTDYLCDYRKPWAAGCPGLGRQGLTCLNFLMEVPNKKQWSGWASSRAEPSSPSSSFALLPPTLPHPSQRGFSGPGGLLLPALQSTGWPQAAVPLPGWAFSDLLHPPDAKAPRWHSGLQPTRHRGQGRDGRMESTRGFQRRETCSCPRPRLPDCQGNPSLLYR